METLKEILEKIASCGWDLIAVPAQQWLNGNENTPALVAAIQEANAQGGSCGCELDPLYKKALELLGV